jgi:metal-responsive CopG/Arc/MetJ family transcriptional regulator
MKNKKDVSVNMPEHLNDAVEKQLSYGDSKSEWIRQAIREKIARSDYDDDIPKTALEAHSN